MSRDGGWSIRPKEKPDAYCPALRFDIVSAPIPDRDGSLPLYADVDLSWWRKDPLAVYADIHGADDTVTWVWPRQLLGDGLRATRQPAGLGDVKIWATLRALGAERDRLWITLSGFAAGDETTQRHMFQLTMRTDSLSRVREFLYSTCLIIPLQREIDTNSAEFDRELTAWLEGGR